MRMSQHLSKFSDHAPVRVLFPVMVLFALVAVAFIWMHLAVRQMEQKASGIDTRSLPEFPEMVALHDETKHVTRVDGKVLTDWRPEEPEFWENGGEKIQHPLPVEKFDCRGRQ